MAWPVAMVAFCVPGMGPMQGRPSGVQGRRPDHGSMPSKSLSLKAGKNLQKDSMMPCTRLWLTERSVPQISIVPPTRSFSPMGVTATRASLSSEQRRGNSVGFFNVSE